MENGELESKANDELSMPQLSIIKLNPPQT
jgi:hypothetical protein